MSSTTTSEQSQPINRILTAEAVMLELWNRAAPGLTREELRWFAGATEQAEVIIHSLHPVVEGIGCLISADGQHDNMPNAGNFQSAEDVPGLLFNITNQLQTIAGLIRVGDSAAQRLYLPEAYAYEKKEGR